MLRFYTLFSFASKIRIPTEEWSQRGDGWTCWQTLSDGPPMRSKRENCGKCLWNFEATTQIWLASSRVGEMIIAPTWIECKQAWVRYKTISQSETKSYVKQNQQKKGNFYRSPQKTKSLPNLFGVNYITLRIFWAERERERESYPIESNVSSRYISLFCALVPAPLPGNRQAETICSWWVYYVFKTTVSDLAAAVTCLLS